MVSLDMRETCVCESSFRRLLIIGTVTRGDTLEGDTGERLEAAEAEEDKGVEAEDEGVEGVAGKAEDAEEGEPRREGEEKGREDVGVAGAEGLRGEAGVDEVEVECAWEEERKDSPEIFACKSRIALLQCK